MNERITTINGKHLESIILHGNAIVTVMHN